MNNGRFKVYCCYGTRVGTCKNIAAAMDLADNEQGYVRDGEQGWRTVYRPEEFVQSIK